LIVEINNVGCSKWSVSGIHPQCPDGSWTRGTYKDIPAVVDLLKRLSISIPDGVIDRLRDHGIVRFEVK
jgi:hypothetical protein